MRPASQSAAIIGQLVGELARGRVDSVAFVVASDATCTLPLYDIAIETARCGWRIGIPNALYWFVTPEPTPLARNGTTVSAAVSQRLEPEGITFIGSTYAEVRHGVVLLDPQDAYIKPDRTVTLHGSGVFEVRPAFAAGTMNHTITRPGISQACLVPGAGLRSDPAPWLRARERQ
jgi:hypothetical protein